MNRSLLLPKQNLVMAKVISSDRVAFKPAKNVPARFKKNV